MSKKLFLLILLSSLTCLSLIQPNLAQTSTKKQVYSCIKHNGNPTTVVDTPRGRIELIVWQSGFFSGSGWTPEKRCQEIAKRFQKFSDNGTLRYISTGVINKQNVVCVVNRQPGKGYDCIKDGLLLTLQPQDNPNQVMKELFSSASKVGGTPITRDPEGKEVFAIDDYINEEAPVMDNSNTESKPPESKPPESKPPESKPPSNSSTGNTTIECPALLCD
jgi:hypothetical protein